MVSDIKNLQGALDETNVLLRNRDNEFFNLEEIYTREKNYYQDQINQLFWENHRLKQDMRNMHYFVKDNERLIKLKEELFKQEKEELNAKKIALERYEKSLQLKHSESEAKVEKKLEELEMQKKELSEKKIRQQKKTDLVFKFSVVLT